MLDLIILEGSSDCPVSLTWQVSLVISSSHRAGSTELVSVVIYQYQLCYLIIGGEISIHFSSLPFLRKPFVPICVIFSLFFSFISLKNFHHHRFEVFSTPPTEIHFSFSHPCGIWSPLDELWRVLWLSQTRIPRRYREGVRTSLTFQQWLLRFLLLAHCAGTPSNSGFLLWARPSCDLCHFSMWPCPNMHPTSVIHDPVILVTPSMTLSSSRPRPWPSHLRELVIHAYGY